MAAPGMAFVAIFGILIILVGVIGIILMTSRSLNVIRYGGLFLILVALIAYPSVWGFFLGSALMILGGIGVLGEIVGKKSTASI